MSQPTPLLSRSFDLPIGSINLKPAYWQAMAVLFLVFLLIFTFARLRHLYVKWSFKGFLPAVLMGFILAIILEGFLIMSGKTIFVQIIGLENMPKPISTFLDESRQELVEVLGEDQSCEIESLDSTINATLDAYSQLPDDQKTTIQKVICE